jgi:hypothetical protein
MVGGRGLAARRCAAVVAYLSAGCLAACADDPGASPTTTVLATTTATVATSEPAVATTAPAAAPGFLRAPPGTDQATLAAAADVVARRLARMGVTDAAVAPMADGLQVRSSADAYQLGAAAQRHPTTLAPVIATEIGPCDGAGSPTVDGTTRCVTLARTIGTTGPVATAAVQAFAGAGWKLTFDVDAARYAEIRAALATAGAAPVAIVADDDVVLTFRNNVPAQRNAIGPLAEDQARQTAAALVIDDELPVDLEAPPPPPPAGAAVDVDFWTAALGVRVCGTWLPNAPAFGLETGVHSHGDGLVYVHPMTPDEAGEHAVLGLFLTRGGFEATEDRLRLWDGAEHVAGGTCPDGRPAEVRIWVDDVEQQGSPADVAPRNGQVLVLSYDSDPNPPGPPPQLAAIPMPVLDVAP